MSDSNFRTGPPTCPQSRLLGLALQPQARLLSGGRTLQHDATPITQRITSLASVNAHKKPRSSIITPGRTLTILTLPMQALVLGMGADAPQKNGSRDACWRTCADTLGSPLSAPVQLRRETLLRSAGRRTWKIVNVNLRVQRLVRDGRAYPGAATVARACRQASHKASCGTRRPWLCLTATGGQPAMAISHFPAGRREV